MPTITNKRRRFQPERKAQERRRKDRGVDFDYNATAWRRFRKAGLLNEPLCRYCLDKDPPRYTTATVRDHIKPISDGGDIWDNGNIQSLCSTCHNQKSGREAHSHLNNYGKD